MAKRLYVGNLPYGTDSPDLQTLFETYGKVISAQVLSDRETGRSRGFGFVEMENDNEALAAIESLDGQDFQGRRLTINEARARQAGGNSGGGYRGGEGGGGYRPSDGGGYHGGESPGGSGGFSGDRGFAGGRDRERGRDRDRDRGRDRGDDRS